MSTDRPSSVSDSPPRPIRGPRRGRTRGGARSRPRSNAVSGALWLILAALTVAGGLLVRRRVRDVRPDRSIDVTDETVRQIEEQGRVETDEREPLDWKQIREEEDRFWSETWDRPDEPFA